MKKLLQLIACLLVLTMATSVAGAAITASGGGTVNKNRGQITNEELRTLFNENRELMLDIATQVIPIMEEFNLYLICRVKSQIVATDGSVQPVVLPAQLVQLLEQYFNAIGTANEPTIRVSEFMGSNTVSFSFRLAVDHLKGIEYSTDSETQEEWESGGFERLDVDWAIFEHYFTAAIEPRWWEKLPAWLQWILRYICFGWIWMK